jgi:Na+/proline symporter
MNLSIPAVDLIIIVVYMIGIMLVGILSVRQRTLTGEVYFLAGRSLKWPVVGAALFASNISTIHLVGLAQDGYQRGLVVGNFEWMATLTLILLALVFVPFYFKSRISTLPEFLEKRYGPLARSIMAFMAILAALLIHIGISLYAGAEVFDRFFGINVYVSIVIISAVTAIYTVVGGLRAVVVTETIQTVILLGGAVLVTFLALNRLPEKDIHSVADFNRAVDVQHSAESLDAAATIAAGCHWLFNDVHDIRMVGSQLEVIADRIGSGQLDDVALPFEKIADRATENGPMGALKSLLRLRDADAVGEALDGGTADPMAALRQVGAAEFAKAAGELKMLADQPQQAAADLMWNLGTEIKESEKLGLVSTVLIRTGHSTIAAVFADQHQWDTMAPASGDWAAVAADLQAARARVLQLQDMNVYLSSDEPIRTPRLSMLRAEGPYFWLAILLGYPILGVWYWCSDQTIVQRVLGAQSQTSAQHGALFAGLLKILPVFFMVLPGTIGYVILRDKIGDRSAQTLPIMITELMPVGLKGLMAAALLAALMSTIAAALNSVGTLVAKDIVGHFRPQTSDAAQIRIGRVSAVVVMLVAMAWSTQGDRFGTIFEVINKIPALFLAPPITTVFVWGVFWRRGTKQAAVTTLILGLTVGFFLFLVDCGVFGGVEWISDPRHGLGIPFLLQGVYLFCIWSALYVTVSLSTPGPPAAQVEDTTWTNPLQVIFHGKLTGPSDPRLITLLLLGIMAVLYWVFR